MKRILMFIDTVGCNGGAERQFAGLAGMLADSGYKVTVMAYYPERGFSDEMESHGVDVRICDFGGSKFSKIFHAYKTFKKLKPEVVISYKNGANFIASALKLMGQKFRLIVSDRNTLLGTSKAIDLQYQLYKQADYVVPNSHSQARFIESHYPSLKDKVRVITNFTDTDVFRPCEEKCTRKDRIVMVCGRITEQKNILLFLEAVALLKHRVGKSFKVKWYGGVKDEGYYNECKAKIARLDIADVFSFETPRNDIDSAYRAADIFVLPSIYEGFPNVLCEAMSCGLPVVASRVCDNPDIVTEGKDGFLFDPKDVEDMAAKIERVISMPDEELQRMGECGRETIVRLCSKETFLSKYRELI